MRVQYTCPGANHFKLSYGTWNGVSKAVNGLNMGPDAYNNGCCSESDHTVSQLLSELGNQHHLQITCTLVDIYLVVHASWLLELFLALLPFAIHLSSTGQVYPLHQRPLLYMINKNTDWVVLSLAQGIDCR